MLKKILVAAVAAACTAFVASSAMAAPAGHGPRAAGPLPNSSNGPLTNYGPFTLWTNFGNPPSASLHAHTDNGVMTIESSGVQSWDFINQATWHGNAVWQIALRPADSYCVNVHSSDHKFYLNPCQATTGQQFELEAGGGTGNYYIVNAYCTDHITNPDNGLLSAITNTNGSEVDCEFSHGTDPTQQWGFFTGS